MVEHSGEPFGVVWTAHGARALRGADQPPADGGECEGTVYLHPNSVWKVRRSSDGLDRRVVWGGEGSRLCPSSHRCAPAGLGFACSDARAGCVVHSVQKETHASGGWMSTAKPALSFMLQAYSGKDGSLHEIDLKVYIGTPLVIKLSPSAIEHPMPACVLMPRPTPPPPMVGFHVARVGGA